MLHAQSHNQQRVTSGGGVGASGAAALLTPSTAGALPHASNCLNLTRAFKPGTGAPGPLAVPTGTPDAPVALPTSAVEWLNLGFSIPAGGRAHVVKPTSDDGDAPTHVESVSERACYVEALRANKGLFRAWFALGCELEAAECAMVENSGDEDVDMTCFDAREHWYVSVNIEQQQHEQPDAAAQEAEKPAYADDCYVRVVATAPMDDSVNSATAYAMLSDYLGRHSRFATVLDYTNAADGVAPVSVKVDAEQALLKAIALDADQGPVAFAISKYFHSVRAEGISIDGRTYMGKECFARALSWRGLINNADAWIMAAEYLSTHPRGEFPPAVKVQEVFHDFQKCLARAATILLASPTATTESTQQQRETLTSVLLALGEATPPGSTVTVNGKEMTALAMFERALKVTPGLHESKLWLAAARVLVTPDARATVREIKYTSTDCYAAAVRCVSAAAGKTATTREDKTRLAAALRQVAATVPAGADIVVDTADKAAMSDVALAERAIDLDPTSPEGWFALGLALKTYTTARHDLTMHFDASTAEAAEPHSVAVGDVRYTAFSALNKALALYTEVAPSVRSFMHLVDLVAPGDEHAAVVGGIRVTKKTLAAAVVSHATDRPDVWRSLGDALLAEQFLGGLPAASVLMQDVDTRHCFIRALQLSQGASADSWCGLLETTSAAATGATASEDPVVISPEQSFTRRVCALNALRRSGLQGARGWWNLAQTLAEAGYDGNSITLDEIRSDDASSSAGPDGATTSVQQEDLLYERDCVLKALRFVTMDDAAVAIKALVRLAELLQEEGDDATTTVTFRRCVHSVFAQYDFQVQQARSDDDAWVSTKEDMAVGDLAKIAISAYAAADMTSKCLTESAVRRAWGLLSVASPDGDVTISGCSFSAREVAANASA